MPQIDVIDEAFVLAPPAEVAALVRHPGSWRSWFPDLTLTALQDRADAGMRFTVSGALVGTSEYWLEPWGEGTVVHYFLRADVTDARSGAVRILKLREQLREIRGRSLEAKRVAWGIKDTLERGRAAGEPRRRAVAPVQPLVEPALGAMGPGGDPEPA